MSRFYFTFGTTNNQMCKGGWIEVEALGKESAINTLVDLLGRDNVFNEDGFVKCCTIYNQEAWEKTSIYKTGENCGVGCHYVIDGNYYWAVEADLNDDYTIYKIPTYCKKRKYVRYNDTFEEAVAECNRYISLTDPEEHTEVFGPIFTYIDQNTGKFVL